MIEARYIESLKEVRLYQPDGFYWPLKIQPEEVHNFVRFVNEKPVTNTGQGDKDWVGHIAE